MRTAFWDLSGMRPFLHRLVYSRTREREIGLCPERVPRYFCCNFAKCRHVFKSLSPTEYFCNIFSKSSSNILPTVDVSLHSLPCEYRSHSEAQCKDIQCVNLGLYSIVRCRSSTLSKYANQLPQVWSVGGSIWNQWLMDHTFRNWSEIFSLASRTLRGATKVVTFLSVRDKKNVGKDRKGNAF